MRNASHRSCTVGEPMKYGSREYQYAAPLALALVEHSPFRQWVTSKSAFSEFPSARIPHKEMTRHRGNSTAEWWRFHFTEKCRCLGCSGKETDILAIFESESRIRFALHFEVKQPTDRFKNLRAMGFNQGAIHYEHSAGPTKHLSNFNSLMTFEEIETEFPDVAKWLDV
jgi:hypothetical protein